MKNQKYLLVLVLAFLIGVALGGFRASQVLSRRDLRYALVAKENKTGQEVTFWVQRFDDETFQISSSTGMVYSSPASGESNGKTSLTIDLPDDGRLSLRASIFPWEETKISLNQSSRYSQILGREAIEEVAALTELAENQEAAGTSARETVMGKVSLTSSQVDQVVADFASWLSDSSYGQDAIVVREKFKEFISDDTASSQIYSFEAANLTFLARVVGDSDTNVSYLKSQGFYNYSLLGNNLSSDRYEDFQSTASFRLYHLKSGSQRYFSSQAEEAQQLGISSYTSFYDQEVDSEQDSLQIVLASNGKVYYSRDFWLEAEKRAEPRYQEAPADMQEALTQLLEAYASKTETD